VSEFTWRGVIEGFYGRPWSPEDRRWLVERMGGWGMNLYVYAPKDDPLHRQRWREPYPDSTMAEFRDLVQGGARAGVEVGFALSPGLSVRYAAAADRAALVAKFQSFVALGSRFVALGLDDVPSRLVHEEDRAAFDSLAAAHVALAHAVQEGLGADVKLWLVPTDYVGTAATDYLDVLGERLDAGIEVGWTGRTVVSPEILAAEARSRAQTLRRRLLVWDNVPVSDGPMRNQLHLGPYGRRDPGLAQHVSGVLLNPMEHARASALMVRTAADYLREPRRYAPEASWQAALAELGEGAPEALELFAAAHRFSPVWCDARERELEGLLGELRAALAARRPCAPVLERLAEALERRLAAPARLREDLRDRQLAAEIEPWIASFDRETRVMRSALRALALLLGDGPRGAKTHALFQLESVLAAEPAPLRSSYGPRRAMYPQLASLRDDEFGFGSDPWLFRDRCLTDELCAWAEDVARDVLGVRSESADGA
jgi:hyaluronoglucosaminidase